MKLPSYLALSRHGVFYFRLTYFVNSLRKEKRWSLKTKSPVDAKRKSLFLCAAMQRNFNSLGDHSCSIIALIDQQLHAFGNLKMKDNNDFKGFVNLVVDIGGIKVDFDSSNPKDVEEGHKIVLVAMREKARLDNKLAKNQARLNQRTTRAVASDTPSQSQHIFIQAPETISTVENDNRLKILDLIERYKVRNEDRHTVKTMDEYLRMQGGFSEWLSARKGAGHTFIDSVTRLDIADYIDYLKLKGIAFSTIQKKYLAALSGLFALAQTLGILPDGPKPTESHNIFNTREKRKARARSGWQVFTEMDLVNIFNPDTFLFFKKPCDYWLPLLGLLTGGRISELCQLAPNNIVNIDGVWSIDITDEGDDQTVKTQAGIRKIPLHPQLIELGFLDYIEDVRPYGGTIFPYMNPDQYGHYSHTPSRSFGKYLKRVGISDERKVFHSFRSTSNNRLKQNNVSEESRCQFIGHEHDTVNSAIYSESYKLKYLLDNVVSKLLFPEIDFGKLNSQRDQLRESLDALMIVAERNRSHRVAKELRKKGLLVNPLDLFF